MANQTTAPSFPRLPLLGAAGLVLVSLAAATVGRITHMTETPTAAMPTRQLALRVADGAGGAVLLFDAGDGRQVATITGENGFLRGTLRALARERHMESIGPQAAFMLTAWNDGRLTIEDTATGGRIELEAFGPDNLAVFAKLLTAQGHTP